MSKETLNVPTKAPEASEGSLLSPMHSFGTVLRSASNGPRDQLIGTLEYDENTGLLDPLQIFQPLRKYVGGASMLASGRKVTHHRHQLRCAAHAAESHQLED